MPAANCLGTGRFQESSTERADTMNNVIHPKISIATQSTFDRILCVELSANNANRYEAWEERHLKDCDERNGYLRLVLQTHDWWKAPLVSWGCVHFHPTLPELRVIRLATMVGYKRNGLARLIVQHAIADRLRQYNRPFERVTATVPEGNFAAECFFLSMGFGSASRHTADGSRVLKFVKEL